MDMQFSLFTQPSIPLEPKWNVLKIVFDWLDAKPKQAGLSKKADKPKKESETPITKPNNSPKSEQQKVSEQDSDLAGMFD